MLANKKTNQLEKLDEFLGTFGRLKCVKPLYVGLAKIDKEKATEIFNKHKDFYHPIAIAAIENKILAIGVLWGTGLKQELEASGCSYIVKSISELNKLLGFL